MNAPVSIKPPYEAEIVESDGRTVLVLSPEVLALLGAGVGDAISIDEGSSGVVIRRRKPGYEQQMEVMREVMTRRRGALSELAK